MSRDFIASQQGREFKKSPNRDRVTKAIQGIAVIQYLREFAAFLPFRETYDGRLKDEGFYLGLSCTLENLFIGQVGKKTVENWACNLITNEMVRVSFSQDAGWLDPVTGFTRFPKFVNPTTAIDNDGIQKRTITLTDGPHDVRQLYDRMESDFEQLSSFPDTREAPFFAVRSYSRFFNQALDTTVRNEQNSLLLNQFMPFIEPQASSPNTVLNLKRPIFISVASIRANKMRYPATPGLRWVLEKALPSINSGYYVRASDMTEVGCSRSVQTPPDNVYLPDFDYAKDRVGRLYHEFLFGPLAWTLVVNAEGFPNVNIGPSSAGYPKPTCYPDIL